MPVSFVDPNFGGSVKMQRLVSDSQPCFVEHGFQVPKFEVCTWFLLVYHSSVFYCNRRNSMVGDKDMGKWF